MFVREPSREYSANLAGSVLIGRTFASRTYLGVFVEVRRSYIRGPKSFAQHVLGTFALFDEHCLWLAESRPLLWMRKKKKKRRRKKGWRCRYVFHSLRREYFNLLTCGRHSLVSGTQNEIVVSWITLWGMIILTLHFQSCCKFRPKLASHYKPVENKIKFVALSKPCSVN